MYTYAHDTPAIYEIKDGMKNGRLEFWFLVNIS
jgi:hypothetical protein